MTISLYNHPFHKHNDYKPVHICHYCNQPIQKKEKEVYVSCTSGKRDYYAHVHCIEKHDPN
jgi:hypothetical protein